MERNNNSTSKKIIKIFLSTALLMIFSILMAYSVEDRSKTENTQITSTKQKLKNKTTESASIFASFSLEQSTPTKIITPNSDGKNDVFTLKFDNQSGNILTQKKIFDLSGAEIADLTVIGDETAASLVLRWDGKDKNGEIVRSGIYIYQVQAEGKVINGTIVVAR